MAVTKRLGFFRANGRVQYIQRKADEFRPLRHVVFFDSETLPLDEEDPEMHTAFMSCAIFRTPGPDGHGWIRQEKTYGPGGAQLIDDVVSMFAKNSHKVRKVSLIGHNAGFDTLTMALHEHLTFHGFDLNVQRSIITETSKPFLLVYRRELEKKGKGNRTYHHTVEILDSGNYFTMSLAALGSQFGFPKTEFIFHDDPSAEDFNRSRRAMLDPTGPEATECADYCMNDCRVLETAYQALEEFMTVNDLGPLKPTIASTAMNVYQRNFIPDDVDIELHDSPEMFELEESSYAGGAVLARRLFPEETPFTGKQVDFVSMYASVMSQELMPTSLHYYYPTFVPQPSVRDLLKHYAEGRTAIARVRLHVDGGFGDARFPKRTTDSLIFPVGDFSTTLAGPELLRALELGYVEAITEAAVYETNVIFEGYVNFFGSKKVEYAHAGNKPFETLAKLFNNSLYGKWAQTLEKFTDEVDPDDEEMTEAYSEAEQFFELNPDERYFTFESDNGVTHSAKRVNGVLMISNGFRDASRNTNMAIAAHITAYARTRLFDAGATAGWDNVAYCDTDSWMVTDEGFANLEAAQVMGEKFGQLSCEVDITSVQVLGLKHYTITGYEWSKRQQGFDYSKVYVKSRHKGIRADAVLMSDGRYLQTRFERFHPAAVTGRTEGVRISKVTKKGAAADYTKGVVTRGGWVEPHNLKE
jgi:hypothetical protein